MNKVPSVNANAKSQSNATEALLKSSKQLQSGSDFVSDASVGFVQSKPGFDLSFIPAKPSLKTGRSVQCCAKDGSPCSCPECKSAAEKDSDTGLKEEAQSVLSLTGQPTSVERVETTPAEQNFFEEIPDESIKETAAENVSEQSPSTQPEEIPEGETQTTAVEGPSNGSLITEDSTASLSEGQMTKTQFLQQLRIEICTAIGPVLASVGQTTEGCPYLNYWLDLYQVKSAAHIEQTAKRYAPDTSSARSAVEYISIITQRALRAADVWVRTGKITGVPEGVPVTLPNQSSQNENGRAEQNIVQAKAKKGGLKNANDPRAIQKQLGEGQPLASDVRSRMESAFGTSFSDVRTHTDFNATKLSNGVNARAFTIGNHVAFSSGEYQPGTVLGDALIAHELAHTIQQQATDKSVDKMEAGNNDYNELERDADKVSIGVLTSLWGGVTSELTDVAKRSMPLLRSGLKIQRCENKTSPAPSPAPSSTPAPASAPASAPGSAAAPAPAPAPAPPVTLTHTTTTAPVSTGCGGFTGAGRWGLSGASASTNGFVVQKLTFDLKRENCTGARNDFAKTYWEAWEVRSGTIYIGTSADTHNADTFRVGSTASHKGLNLEEGYAKYIDGYTAPNSWGNVPEALSLPSTTSSPAGWSDAGTIHRWLRSDFDCCDGHNTATFTSGGF